MSRRFRSATVAALVALGLAGGASSATAAIQVSSSSSLSSPAPLSGSSLSGVRYVLGADVPGTTRVQWFLKQGTNAFVYKSTDSVAPFTYTLDTRTLSSGSYTVKMAKTVSGVPTVQNETASFSVASGTVTPPVPSGDVSPASGVNAGPLRFDDEFSGSSLDLSKWSTQEGRRMNNVVSHASNVSVDAGQLVLNLANNESGAWVCTCGVSGGYAVPVGGYAEARVYFPGDGTSRVYNWPAWWITGPSWPAAGENDIAEGTGGGWLQIAYHSPSFHGKITIPGGSWFGAFHTYGVYRGAGFSTVYWNGRQVAHYTTSDNGQPEQLSLNIGERADSKLVTGAPGQMKVDYVRVWAP